MTIEQPQESMLSRILKKPLPQEPLSMKEEGKFLLLTNGLQMLLSDRKGLSMEEWQSHLNDDGESWSKKFRKVFEEIITTDPLHFMGYGTLGDIPEMIIVDIERRLYQ